jgi:hypothetical protein
MLTGSLAAGQSTSTGDAEVMNYRLSMEKLRRLIPVQRALNALDAKDPQLFEKMNLDKQAGGRKEALTVKQKASIMDQYPEVKQAFAGAGTTAREWLLTTEAMGDAYIWIETKKGTLEGPPPTTDAQKANVALLEKNQAEFQKIMQELDQLMDEMLSR